jgi:hypothetical protein
MPALKTVVSNVHIQALAIALLLAILAASTVRAIPTELPATKIASLHETRTCTPSRAKFLARRQSQSKNLPIRSFGEDSVGPTSGSCDIFGPGRKPQVELQPPSVPETLPTPFVTLVLSAVLGLGARKLKTS